MPRSGPPKRRPARRPRAPKPGPRIKWRGFNDTPNVKADEQHQRYYKAETLESAFAKLLATNDTLIAPALKTLSADADTANITLQLHYEFAHALIFHGSAGGKGKKPAEFRLIVAKDAEDRSLAVRRTWKALTHAYSRAPKNALRPLAETKIFLPDRHRRVEKGREIYCCVTAVAPQAHPLCVARGGRLAELLHTPKLLSVADEAQVCRRLIQLAAQLYDAKAQTGVILPDLASNQIEAIRKGRNIRLLVALPEGLRTRLTVPRFIHELVTWNAAGAGTTARIRPPELEDFHAALVAGVGPETAADWLSRYKRSIVQRKLPVVPPLLPEDMTAIGIE